MSTRPQAPTITVLRNRAMIFAAVLFAAGVLVGWLMSLPPHPDDRKSHSSAAASIAGGYAGSQSKPVVVSGGIATSVQGHPPFTTSLEEDGVRTSCNGLMKRAKVKGGDTLDTLVATSGVNLQPSTERRTWATRKRAVEVVAKMNDIKDSALIHAGDRIWLPVWCESTIL